MKHTFQRKYTLFICSALFIASVLSCNSVYASNNTAPNIATTENNTTTSAQVISNNETNNSKIDRTKERRELASFFIIGLGINFVMLLVFIYWAVGQWRQNKDQ